MTKQYWVGEFYVDLSRNQISQQGQPQTLPPKALLVLTLLAENRGRVVSYEELFDKVWPNSIVTPNTLQRSIAQLRKVLGENSKAQNIIKTHAKQGYSLECEVNWLEDVLSESVNSETAEISHIDDESYESIDEPASDEQALNSNEIAANDGVPKESAASQSQGEPVASDTGGVGIQRYWLVAAVAILVSIFLIYQGQNGTQFEFGDTRYLTATDDKEYGAIYTPNGKYILFRRYYDKICINNIWAKNADTLEEVQLTKERGTFNGHSLSPDGNTLAFIKQEDCTKPVTQNICYKLMTLNFNKALSEPQKPTEILHCQNSAISAPLWIDNQHIAMMQKRDERWRLINFSLEDESSSDFYQIEDGSILSFAYSREKELFLVSSIKNDGQQYIDMLTLDGELKSSHQIQLPENTQRPLKVIPKFIPNSEDLIFGASGQIFLLTQQGVVSKVELPIDAGVGGPYFHPDGKRLLLVTGRYDSDIGIMPVPTNESEVEEFTVDEAVNSVIERSNTRDDYGKFQPNGSSIAMLSNRTGTGQVWLIGADNTAVISNFMKRTSIGNMIWDYQGTSLLVVANNKLVQLFTNAEATAVNFPYPVTDLFYWDSEKHEAIANILVNGTVKFVTIDLNSLAYESINDKRVYWAAKGQNSPLIFIDQLDRFWQQGAVEDMLIEPLTGQGSEKRFVVENGLAYGINKTNQLWSYNFQTNDFKILAEVTKDIDYLTDIKGNELLYSLLIAEKKEVFELSLTN